MFDITEEKRDKFYFEERPLPPHINFEDGDDNEQLLERGAIAFYAQGRTLEPLKTSQGIAFINTRYLKPFSDIDAGYELYERTTAQRETVYRGKERVYVTRHYFPLRPR